MFHLFFPTASSFILVSQDKPRDSVLWQVSKQLLAFFCSLSLSVSDQVVLLYPRILEY